MLKKSIFKKINNKVFQNIVRGFGEKSHGHESSGSDSGSDHGHHDSHGHDHHDHHGVKHKFLQDRQEPWNILKHTKGEQFDVVNLVEKLREPITKKNELFTSNNQSKDLCQIEKEYVEFLTKSFTEQCLKQYPDYKSKDLSHLIPGFEKMNSYEKEVSLLDAYMNQKVNNLKEESRNIQGNHNTGCINKDLEELKKRAELLFKISKPKEGDTRVMESIKKKLKKVLESDLKYAQFLVDYNNKKENNLLQKVVESKVLGYSKTNLSKQNSLNNLKSSGNPNYHPYSVEPHDHIKIDNWNKEVNKTESERYKYLAMYDIAIDQHLRRIRPSNLDDNEDLYTPKYNKKTNVYDYYYKNTEFEYTCRNDNEYYVKFLENLKNSFPYVETHDNKRPVGKHWKEENKFPHLATRLGYDELQEHPLDKNPFIERVLSNPLYQWQPFVQTPNISADESLDLEIGDTFYEDKHAYEWNLFMKLLVLLPISLIAIILTQVYENDYALSIDYMRRFFPSFTPWNPLESSTDKKRFTGVNWWGADHWNWQTGLRKGGVYPLLIVVLYMVSVLLTKIGNTRVLKACFNRSKDLVFVTVPDGFISKKVIPVELHYLEKIMPFMATSWKYMPEINGNKHGDIIIENTYNGECQQFYFRANEKFWNPELKKYFDSQTSTYWQGNSCKDINRGLRFNNSPYMTVDENNSFNEIENEIVKSVEKYGPIKKHDYEHSFNYQVSKKIAQYKRDLLVGANH